MNSAKKLLKWSSLMLKSKRHLRLANEQLEKFEVTHSDGYLKGSQANAKLASHYHKQAEDVYK